MKHAIIRFRVGEPADLSDLPEVEYDWELSVYGDVKEATPYDAPTPRGDRVTMIHYVDANLYHDLLTGRSVTSILHILNQCPIKWFSKKQATVEMATYGSEFVAARICTDQVIGIRYTLRYLGVPIGKKSYNSMRALVGTIDVDMVLGHLASSTAAIILSSGEPEEMEQLIRAFTGQLRIKADAISRGLAILDNPHVAH
jgi:hypothetical protein